tara:strand:+ start:1742 stop:3760 length:2019 start_codon:yes stop_codon:yes gene_type:complete
MQRWLLRNPWIHPFIVFVFSASKIQKIVRGFIVRKHGKLHEYIAWRKRMKNKLMARTQVSVKGKSPQLDKYLRFLDMAKIGMVEPPEWLDGGYSVWCVVRLQAWFRMTKPRRRHLYMSHIIHHIAAMIIQAAIKAKLIRLRDKRVMQEAAKIARVPPHRASVRIQLAWRRFCNRRIFQYYRDLILNKLQGAPQDLLKTIVPQESELLDRACGAMVRFRLGGRIFPPKVFFKVYTHRGVCDVNAFAPRVYAKEKIVESFQQNLHSVYVPKDRKKYSTGIRVGGSYFGTQVLSNTSTDEWYKREENNDWRPIASQSFDDILTPPWLRETPQKKEPAPFHFSKLKRKTDLVREKKRRRRMWLMKAYTLAGVNLSGMDGDMSISSADMMTGKGVSSRTAAAATHDLLYGHTSDSQELGSVTRSQLETIYSPTGSPVASRGQTPDGHRVGRRHTSSYDAGGARTYSAEQGGGVVESKEEREQRLHQLDHDSISESLAFLSMSEAEHQTSRSLEMGDLNPDMLKFDKYLSASLDGNDVPVVTGSHADRVILPSTSVEGSSHQDNTNDPRRGKTRVVRPDAVLGAKDKRAVGVGLGEAKDDSGGEIATASGREGKGRLKLPPIDSAEVHKAVDTKIKALEDNDDLLNWSLALDYEEYDTNWARLGTSLPSSSRPQAFYK